MGKCKDCKWCDKTSKKDKLGKCRKHAPQEYMRISVEDDVDILIGLFPHTNSEDWCGEFEKKE